MSIVLIFVVVILVIILWRDTRKPAHFPPGPNWLPLIGAMPMLMKLHGIHRFYHLVWHYFSQLYGPIVGLRAGRDRIIIVSGKEAVREFYSMSEFDGRPAGFFYRMRTFDRRLGVVFSDGPMWETQRRFSMKVLRQLGMGRSCMIEHIEREAVAMVEHFRESSGQSIEMDHAFDVPVLNVLWALLAGHRFDLGDQRLPQLLKLIHDSFRVIDMSGGVLNQFPFVRHLAPNACGYRPLINTIKPIWGFLKEIIADIKNSMSDEKPRSFIESFLLEIETATQDIHSTFTEQQLLAVCLDLFQAGTETTSNTLAFGIVHLLHNEVVQKRVRDELDRVIGPDRLPNLNDRPHLPYMDAVICEIQRISTVAPLGIIHRCTETVKFREFVIPKDTMALVSLYSVHMDPIYWKDPTTFRPERFLNSFGQILNHDSFLPFGLGKRRCMGENLAKSSMFLFLACLIHSFHINVGNDEKLPDAEGIDGITLSPKPFKVVLTSRF